MLPRRFRRSIAYRSRRAMRPLLRGGSRDQGAVHVRYALRTHMNGHV